MSSPVTGAHATTADALQAELRKLELEYELKAQEAVRAHRREMDKVAVSHHNLVAANAATAEAQLDLERFKSEQQLKADRIRTSAAADEALNALFHQKVAEVAVAGVDRARDSAKFMQTAVTAVFALYTGLLALVYSVTDNPLPLRGAWAGVFLGLSIAFATAYLSFLTKVPTLQLTTDTTSTTTMQYSRTANLTRWVNGNIQRRTFAIRAAVLSLLFGVLFIAAPFVSTATPTSSIPIPSAPVAPAEVDDAFEEVALSVFQSQAEDYRNAVAARAAALAAAEETARERFDRERDLDEDVSRLAGYALLVVLVGPILFSMFERALAWARDRRARQASNAARAVSATS